MKIKSWLYVCGVFFVTPLFSQSNLPAADSLFESFAKKQEFSGSVFIAENGEIVFDRAFGWQNYELKRPLQTSTPIPLASVSKCFTATSIMKLKSEGKLDYDDLVVKYLSNFPYEDITIRHLLLHTAGFRRFENHSIKDAETFDHTGILKYLITKQPKLSFRPGTKFQYSNTGYAVLACIIEKISHLEYSDYVQTKIFAPLNMGKSFIIDSVTEKDHALSYDKNWKNADKNMNSYTGAIGVYSTTGDLYKFDQALYADSLVSQELLRDGFKNGRDNSGSEVMYAFGWRHWKMAPQQIFNRGDWWGVATILFRDIDKKRTIIILQNRRDVVESSELVELILKILDKRAK